MAKRKLNPRKLLVASIGVATISYLGSTSVACSSDDDDGRTGTKGDDPTDASNQDTGTVPTSPTVANLVAPPPSVANLVAPAPPTVANLVAPPPEDAAASEGDPEVIRLDASIANLVAPPPTDGGARSK